MPLMAKWIERYPFSTVWLVLVLYATFMVETVTR
jgi:hypothetical protein